MRRGFVLAAGWLVLIILAALFSPIFLAEKAQNMNFSHLLEKPQALFWFGTDALGRDVFSRLLVGSSVSLGVSFFAILIAALTGILVGALAGYYGGALDKFLMMLVNTALCFPTFFLILAVIAIFGPHIFNIALIIGLTSWMGVARLVRAEVLTLKEREFVQAAEILGAGNLRILARHIIPNTIRPVLVSAVLGFSTALLVESGLSFLGVGVQPPSPSWGNMLMDGKACLGVAWWMSVFPGVFIFLTVFSANVMAEHFNKVWHGEN